MGRGALDNYTKENALFPLSYFGFVVPARLLQLQQLRCPRKISAAVTRPGRISLLVGRDGL